MKLTFNVSPERLKLVVARWEEVKPFCGESAEMIPVTIQHDETSAEITMMNGDILQYKAVDFANWGC